MDTNQLQLLFMPQMHAAALRVREGNRLVHDTSAEAAYRIITGKQVWLRSVHLMNDYSELRHGLTCLQQAWVSPAGQRLQDWLEQRWPGLRDGLRVTFDGHADGLLEHTFILSLSKHDDDEDQFGRLSMWRAYGGRAGVALVLNTTTFLSDTDALSVFSTPVVYQGVPDYVEWFARWLDALIGKEASLAAVDRDQMLGLLFYAFRVTVLATKHPGLQDEKEWRVFHTLALDGSSTWVSLEPEIIQGTPQHVIKFHLEDDPNEGVNDVAPKGLINRVIIGPCESPIPIRNALWAAMEQAGVEGIADKISMSFIPLRQR